MSTLALLTTLLFLTSPSPADIRGDLDAHPWRPDPATSVKSESSSTQASSAKVSTQRAAAKDSARPASGSWQVQLGAISSPEAASAEKKRLEKILGAGSVEIFADKGVHKLRYGSFSTKEEAENARTGLKSKGLDGFAVPKP
jgi:cell division protein FtsN